MTSLRRPVIAATLSAFLLLAGCTSAEETTEAADDGPAIDSATLAPEESESPSPTPTPSEDAEDEGEDGEETEGEETDPETLEGEEGEEPAPPPIPKITPDEVALTFQEALVAGDGRTACAELARDAARRLTQQGIDKGIIDKGDTCVDYVDEIGETYEGWDVDITAHLVDQAPRTASARLEMRVNGDPNNTRMTMRLVGNQWKIVDWGSH